MKKECEKFKLDLTDYAGGDTSQIADIKAFKKHLISCTDCRTELNKLRKTLGLLVSAEPRSAQFQKKMDALKQRGGHKIQMQSMPLEEERNIAASPGKPAGSPANRGKPKRKK